MSPARPRELARQLYQVLLGSLPLAIAAGRILGKEVDANTHRALIERSLDEAGSELGTQH